LRRHADNNHTTVLDLQSFEAMSDNESNDSIESDKSKNLLASSSSDSSSESSSSSSSSDSGDDNDSKSSKGDDDLVGRIPGSSEAVHIQEDATMETSTPEIKLPERRILDLNYAEEQHSERRRSEPEINWDELGNEKWGKRPLFFGLEPSEISSLVGLATTLDPSKDRDESRITYPPMQEPRKSNPLLSIDRPPLPPSYLNFIIYRAMEMPGIQQTLGKEFETSALVAIGLLLEEMITASLLPLAELHVIRCRELENIEQADLESDEIPDPNAVVQGPICGEKVVKKQMLLDPTEKAFDEWTLPPEEAMMKLLDQNFIPMKGIPILQEPTRSLVGPSPRQSADNKKRKHIESLSEGLSISKELARCNPELLKLVLPEDPSSDRKLGKRRRN
jgi:hypothetical protein